MAYINEQIPENQPEPQTRVDMWDDLSVRPGFIDLRPLEEDRVVLKNPHKGWFWHFIDNGLHSGWYRNQNVEGDYLEDFPGMNHLYLRFDWSDVEIERGVYDWSPLDKIMEEWGPHGYTFSMRVCAFEAGSGTRYSATPTYVFEDGAKCYHTMHGDTQVDYGDPIFLNHLERFMAEFGRKYNGDPRLEILDIGTYGTWGEGHTVHGDGKIYPTSVVKKHMDLHAKYFPDTFVLCNDDHIVGRTIHGQAEVCEMMDYAEARGFGLQDDSICIYDGAGYNTARADWAFRRLGKYAPNCIELQHYAQIGDAMWREGLTSIEAYRDVQATFAGFHGYPRPWLEKNPYLTEYCANRLGYWFFVPYAYLYPLQNTAHNAMRLCLENRGWAKAYHPYKLKVRLKNEQNTYVLDTLTDVREWGPGDRRETVIPLDLRNVTPGDYALQIGLFEGERAIKLAMRNCIDGYWYTITKTTVAGV